jgi:hypothetical protein
LREESEIIIDRSPLLLERCVHAVFAVLVTTVVTVQDTTDVIDRIQHLRRWQLLQYVGDIPGPVLETCLEVIGAGIYSVLR